LRRSSESYPSVARVEGNTKKIRSILCPSILCLFLGPLVKGRSFAKVIRKYAVATYLLQKSGGASVFFFVSSFYLPPSPSPGKSDEGLTERTRDIFLPSNKVKFMDSIFYPNYLPCISMVPLPYTAMYLCPT
jgi:hypothetical protein